MRIPVYNRDITERLETVDAADIVSVTVSAEEYSDKSSVFFLEYTAADRTTGIIDAVTLDPDAAAEKRNELAALLDLHILMLFWILNRNNEWKYVKGEDIYHTHIVRKGYETAAV